MHVKAAKPIVGVLVLTLSILVPISSSAQQALGAALSGTVTAASGEVVTNADVSVRNVATGKITQTQTNLAGFYSVPNLMAGDYEVSVSAEGFSTKTDHVTLSAGASQMLDFALSAGLSLQGLGFSQAQIQGNAREQARLNKRSHMLKVHQELGLITTAPLLATVVMGSFAGGRSTSSTMRDVHAGLGSLTASLYFASAYYAIFAPKIAGTKAHGPIRLHKALAWIHGPGMILTPVLGAMAFSQRSRGERVHGIASAHGAVAYVTAAAYVAAILAVSRPGFLFHPTHHLLAALGFEHSDSANSSPSP
jgi:Carboxypeptidase regulatory-like domain